MARIIGIELNDVRSDSMTQHGIGILGGTFDPIHNGHIQIAETVLNTLQLKCIELIPCFQPPHRHQPIASAADRLAMVKLAIQSHPQLHANEIEMDRQGISYSVDTLTALRKQMPHQPLCFIFGADAFSAFHRWHEWQKIPALVHLIIVGRPNAELPSDPDIQTLLRNNQTNDVTDLQKNSAGKIYFLNNALIDISATQIRQLIQSGEKNIIELDKSVEKYIAEHGVY